MRSIPSWRRTAVAAAGMLALILASAGPARAGLAVSPLKQEVVVKPGEAKTVRIDLSNATRGNSDTPRAAKIEVMDFTVSEQGGILFQEAGTRPNSASPWVALSKTQVKLAPGESEQLECTIRAPRHAQGEYYCAVMVTLETPTRTPKGIGIGYRIASGLFITVPGPTLPKKAEIVRCGVVWPPTDSTAEAAGSATKPDRTENGRPGPVRLEAVIKNTGRVRFDASGQMRIRRPDGQVVWRSPLKTERACVQAGDTRLFEGPLDKPLAAGEYLLEVDFDYQSAWSKARAKLPLTISETQAALLVDASRHIPTTAAKPGPVVQVAPETLSVRVPPGAMRVLKASVTNLADGPALCRAVLRNEGQGPGPASWMALACDTFVLENGRSKTVPVVLRVPSDATGIHRAMLALEIDEAGATLVREIAIELRVSPHE